MKKKILLFDADHTLLDFEATEKKGLEHCFALFQIPFTAEVRRWYLAHNKRLWDSYERGEIPRQTIFDRRFPETFSHFGFAADGIEMEKEYRKALTAGYDMIDNAMEVIRTLSRSHRLFIVTNGMLVTQNNRLEKSGLMPYFEDIFISEVTGFQKPMREYFDYCFDRISVFSKADTLLIGDSLSSDIQGGLNAGIDTCWYNPKHLPNGTGFRPTAEISDLRALYSLLELA